MQRFVDIDNFVSIHSRNLQILAIEIFKITKGNSLDLFASIT